MQSNAFRRYVVILECVTLEQSCTQEDLESLAEIWPKLSDSERRSLRGSAPCDVARFLGEPPQLWDGRRWRGSREHRERMWAVGLKVPRMRLPGATAGQGAPIEGVRTLAPVLG